MDLTGIVSVSGISGLHKIVAHTKSGLLIESLADGKRFPVYSTARISALSDISIFGVKEDIPLDMILKAIRDKQSGKSYEGNLNDAAQIKEHFKSFIPDFDESRVYNSDIRKVFSWYNQLLAKNLLADQEIEKEEAEKGKPRKESAEKKETADKKPKTSAKGKATPKAGPKASSKGMAKTQTVRKTGG